MKARYVGNVKTAIFLDKEENAVRGVPIDVTGIPNVPGDWWIVGKGINCGESKSGHRYFSGLPYLAVVEEVRRPELEKAAV